MERVTFIQTGFGLFGEGWTDLLLRTEGVELYAVVDPAKEAQERFQKRFGDRGIAFFRSLEEALEKAKAQAVLVVTPNSVHREVAERALSAGLHVLSEKPLADNWKNALGIYALWAKNPHCVYGVSQNYRFRPEIQALKKVMAEAPCGNVEYGTYEFHQEWKMGGWRMEMEYPLLEDMSIHHFDILRFVLGKEAESVYMESFNPSFSPFQGGAVAFGSIYFSSGLPLQYFGSWVSRGHKTSWNGTIRFFGEKGTIALEDDRLFFITKDGKREEILFPRYETDGRIFVLREFIEAVKNQKEPSISLADNLKTFALVCAAVESAKRGEVVALRYYFEDLRHAVE